MSHLTALLPLALPLNLCVGGVYSYLFPALIHFRAFILQAIFEWQENSHRFLFRGVYQKPFVMPGCCLLTHGKIMDS